MIAPSEAIAADPVGVHAHASPFSSFAASQKLFVYMCAIFVACLLLGDVIGGKIIRTPLGPISVGIIPFPVTFLLTDVVNDFYARRGVPHDARLLHGPARMGAPAGDDAHAGRWLDVLHAERVREGLRRQRAA